MAADNLGQSFAVAYRYAVATDQFSLATPSSDHQLFCQGFIETRDGLGRIGSSILTRFIAKLVFHRGAASHNHQIRGCRPDVRLSSSINPVVRPVMSPPVL